jgi:hypothetical protein
MLKSFQLPRWSRNILLLRNRKVLYHAHNSASLEPVLSQLAEYTPSYAITVGSISLLSSHLQLFLQSGSFPLRFFDHTFICVVTQQPRELAICKITNAVNITAAEIKKRFGKQQNRTDQYSLECACVSSGEILKVQ